MTKTFIPLENNPEVMTPLAHRLGLSPTLSFHDVYSLTDPDLLALIPRPVHALLFVYPHTTTCDSFHESENAKRSAYSLTSGPQEPVLWFPQTINNACGLIGLLHCTTSGSARNFITQNSDLHSLMIAAIPLHPTDRAKLLENSDILEAAHAEAAQRGDSTAPPLGESPGNSFIAFVKGSDGHLWQLGGSEKGPTDLGTLGEDEDVMSEAAIKAGPLRYLEKEKESGDSIVNFSCTALAESMD